MEVLQSGVYRIVNTVTNTTYIGSSVRVDNRLRDHRTHLDNNRHANIHLQNSWIKHGHEAFRFEPLVTCDRADMVTREQAFIDAYVEHDMPIYNKKPSANPRSVIRYVTSNETRAKQSAAHIGRPKSAEMRARLSASHHNRTHEHKANLLAARRARSPEYKTKISAALRGHAVSAETRAKIAVGHLGKKHSPEHIAKRVKVNTGKMRSLEIRKRLSESAKVRALKFPMPSRKGVAHTPESRARMSVAHRRGQIVGQFNKEV